MPNSTVSSLVVASGHGCAQELAEKLAGQVAELCQLAARFCQGPPTPEGTYTFEERLMAGLREMGRVTMETVLNSCERDDAVPPARVRLGSTVFRRRRRHPHTIGTLFGKIVLARYLYEGLERGERSIHLLEMQLGIEAGIATPCLAERVGWWTASNSERRVLEIVGRENDVGWSKKTLRKLTASLSQGMASHRHGAQVAKVLGWLEAANESRGRHRPVLCVGRDGVNAPIRDSGYHEGSVGTVSVYDRRGRRLGTVYVACMPESGQVRLSQQLTDLILDVLRQWKGAFPRLSYVSDDGHHPREYFRRVLRRMEHPCQPGTRLCWERVVDYYHATEYISRMAEALFRKKAAGYAWARRMRRNLKNKPNGVVGVLRSAAAVHRRRMQKMSDGAAEAYCAAYGYLSKRRQYMQYHTYKRLGLPIGSGVTEAACKTVFTQRLKQSGMSWTLEGGQVVLDLRVLELSGVWADAHRSYLRSKTVPCTSTSTVQDHESVQIAA